MRIISLCILATSFSLLFIFRDFSPIYRLTYASVGLIFLIKISSLFFKPSKFSAKKDLLTYLFMWPGVSTKGFGANNKSINTNKASKGFLGNWISFVFGVLFFLASSLIGKGESTFLNYVSLLSFFFIIHMGLVDILRSFLILGGYSPNKMFNQPFKAESLRDFWSFRWNKAFVEMNKIFIQEPMKNYLSGNTMVLLIFIISGILHEIGISFSSGQDYGRPFLYFIIQGVGFILERKVKLGRLITLLVILVPLPLLFPPSFVNLFLGSLSNSIYNFYEILQLNDLIKYLFIIGGVLNSFVILASIQVPSKLNWKQDLGKLSNFNRKIFYTYSAYIFSIIIFISIACFLIAYHEDFQSISTKIITIFILIFWVGRLIIDFFYYNKNDWPKGALFEIGHICLTTLFITLCSIFFSLSLLLFYLSK